MTDFANIQNDVDALLKEVFDSVILFNEDDKLDIDTNVDESFELVEKDASAIDLICKNSLFIPNSPVETYLK